MGHESHSYPTLKKNKVLHFWGRDEKRGEGGAWENEPLMGARGNVYLCIRGSQLQPNSRLFTPLKQ